VLFGVVEGNATAGFGAGVVAVTDVEADGEVGIGVISDFDILSRTAADEHGRNGEGKREVDEVCEVVGRARGSHCGVGGGSESFCVQHRLRSFENVLRVGSPHLEGGFALLRRATPGPMRLSNRI